MTNFHREMAHFGVFGHWHEDRNLKAVLITGCGRRTYGTLRGSDS
jgi:hypothetical protein